MFSGGFSILLPVRAFSGFTTEALAFLSQANTCQFSSKSPENKNNIDKFKEYL
jgi:hypothetical protein